MNSSPRDVVTRHYEASVRGDLRAMLVDFAPDVSWTEMAGFPYAGTYIGPDAVGRNVFQRLDAEWQDFAAEPDQLVAEGEFVVAFGYYTGRCAATGRSVCARFTHRWRVVDGQVVRFEQFTDTALFDRAVSGEVAQDR